MLKIICIWKEWPELVQSYIRLTFFFKNKFPIFKTNASNLIWPYYTHTFPYIQLNSIIRSNQNVKMHLHANKEVYTPKYIF